MKNSEFYFLLVYFFLTIIHTTHALSGASLWSLLPLMAGIILSIMTHKNESSIGIILVVVHILLETREYVTHPEYFLFPFLFFMYIILHVIMDYFNLWRVVKKQYPSKSKQYFIGSIAIIAIGTAVTTIDTAEKVHTFGMQYTHLHEHHHHHSSWYSMLVLGAFFGCVASDFVNSYFQPRTLHHCA